MPVKEFGPQEGMLLDLESGEYYGLEGAALALWKRLDGHTTRDELCAHVTATFDGAGPGVDAHVDAFLRQLRSAGLLSGPGASLDAERGAGRSRARAGARPPYRAPRLHKRGNLKYLGQLD